MVAGFPGSLVFGPLDSALLQDATKGHFCKEMDRVNTFVNRWMVHAGECHSWIASVAREILTGSGLHAFSPTARERAPYVMHYRLAVFVYKRLFRFPAAALRVEQADPFWTLNGENATLAFGSKEQMEMLVGLLDKLLASEEVTARTLREKAGEMQKSFQELTPMLDYAIASRRLRKRCDLVTFF